MASRSENSVVGNDTDSKHLTSSNLSSPIIFPTLPLEVRERIYHYILPPPLSSLYPPPPFLGRNLISDLTYNILHLNKVTRVDAGIYYLRSRCFQIFHPNEKDHFERYLSRFPDEQGFDAVRRLGFMCFSQVPVDGQGRNSYMRLTEKCACILELSLTFRPEDLRRVSHKELWRMSEHARRINPGDLAFVPMEVIVQRYSLSSLMKLSRLQRVEVVVKHARVANRNPEQQVRDVAPDRLMGGLCEWLRKAFSQRGTAVKVLLRDTR